MSICVLLTLLKVMTSSERAKTHFYRSGDVMRPVTSLRGQNNVNVIPIVMPHYNPIN